MPGLATVALVFKDQSKDNGASNAHLSGGLACVSTHARYRRYFANFAAAGIGAHSERGGRRRCGPTPVRRSGCGRSPRPTAYPAASVLFDNGSQRSTEISIVMIINRGVGSWSGVLGGNAIVAATLYRPP